MTLCESNCQYLEKVFVGHDYAKYYRKCSKFGKLVHKVNGKNYFEKCDKCEGTKNKEGSFNG